MNMKSILSGSDISDKNFSVKSSQDVKSMKERCQKVYSSLDEEYKLYEPLWKVLAEYSNSFRGRFKNEDKKEFLSRSDKIIDNTANKALNFLSSGLQSGLTNQSTRWFAYGLEDEELMEWHPVKLWLRRCEDVSYSILNKSNFYKLTPNIYKELGTFSQGCLFHTESVKSISQFNDFTCGEYMLGSNGDDVVDTLGRYMRMSVGQIVSAFGLKNCTQAIQDAYDRGNVNQKFNVIHSIMPNFMMNKGKIDNKNKAFLSVYWVEGSDDKEVLSVSGFDAFPAHTPRWERVSNEVYGISPLMHGLGIVKSLQKFHEIRHFGAHMMAKPPLNVPKSMWEDGVKPSLVPGGINLYNDAMGASAATSAINVNIDINAIREIIKEGQSDIMESMYADVFRMISDAGATTSATAIMEMKEEKMVLLGPVLNNIITDFLAPTCKLNFEYAQNLGAFPPPPPELEGKEIEIEFISTLAQAQKMMEVRSTQEFAGFVGSLASVNPNALKKLNVNEAIDDYAEKRGVNPKIVVATDDVEDEIAAENAQAAQMQQMEQAKQALAGVETLSKISGNLGA
ncbi:MAG: portal protein [Alphaproteobacteria bacterium]|nr:portal protein [Alphaproteobacteria bacterium]